MNQDFSRWNRFQTSFGRCVDFWIGEGRRLSCNKMLPTVEKTFETFKCKIDRLGKSAKIEEEAGVEIETRSSQDWLWKLSQIWSNQTINFDHFKSNMYINRGVRWRSQTFRTRKSFCEDAEEEEERVDPCWIWKNGAFRHLSLLVDKKRATKGREGGIRGQSLAHRRAPPLVIRKKIKTDARNSFLPAEKTKAKSQLMNFFPLSSPSWLHFYRISISFFFSARRQRKPTITTTFTGSSSLAAAHAFNFEELTRKLNHSAHFFPHEHAHTHTQSKWKDWQPFERKEWDLDVRATNLFSSKRHNKQKLVWIQFVSCFDKFAIFSQALTCAHPQHLDQQQLVCVCARVDWASV